MLKEVYSMLRLIEPVHRASYELQVEAEQNDSCHTVTPHSPVTDLHGRSLLGAQ